MSPKIEVDGITYYENEELGVELIAVPHSYHFHDRNIPVIEDLTMNTQIGHEVGTDSLLPDTAVVVWEEGYIGTIHKSHLFDV